MLRVASFAVATVRKIFYLMSWGIVGGALEGVGVYIPFSERPEAFGI